MNDIGHDAVEAAEFLRQVDESMSPESADTPLQIASPEGTKGWTVGRKGGIETFTTPDGIAYVRARTDEEADVIVRFTRIAGMTPMRLVRADQSTLVRRMERKQRREQRELRARGYDV